MINSNGLSITRQTFTLCLPLKEEQIVEFGIEFFKVYKYKDSTPAENKEIWLNTSTVKVGIINKLCT